MTDQQPSDVLGKLYALFDSQIDRDVISIVFNNCNGKVEDTVLTLSSMVEESESRTESSYQRADVNTNEKPHQGRSLGNQSKGASMPLKSDVKEYPPHPSFKAATTKRINSLKTACNTQDKITLDNDKSGDQSSKENADLQFLCECFPEMKIDTLSAIYKSCNNEILKTCDAVARQNSMPSSVRTQDESLPFIEESIKCSDQPCHYDRSFSTLDNESSENWLESAKTPLQMPTTDNSANNMSRIEDVSGAARSEGVLISINRELARKLTKMFPNKDNLNIEEVIEEDLEFMINSEVVYLLYIQLMKSLKERGYSANSKHSKEKDRSMSPSARYRNRQKNAKGSSDPRLTIGTPCQARSPQATKKMENASKLKGSFSPRQKQQPDNGPSQRHYVETSDADSWNVSSKKTLSEMKEKFPSVENEILHDIYLALNCDVDAAIKAVESSIYVDSDLRQSDAEPAVTPVAELLSTENDTREAEKDTSRPSESIQTGSGEKDELPFDVLYSKCRTEARVRTALRNQLLKKAAASYVQQNYHMTEHYTKEANKHAELIRDANTAAAKMIFEKRNPKSGNSMKVDLHGLHCDEAVITVSYILEQSKKSDKKFIDVITGRGSHSKEYISKLQPSIISFLNQNQYRFTMKNAGCLRVHLR